MARAGCSCAMSSLDMTQSAMEKGFKKHQVIRMHGKMGREVLINYIKLASESPDSSVRPEFWLLQTLRLGEP